MSKSKANVIGITMGDPSGIGPEVIARSLQQKSVNRLARFKIIGDKAFYPQSDENLPSNCEFIDLKSLTAKQIVPGKPGPSGARASLLYLNKAVQMLKRGEIASLVTAPVWKEGISSLGIKFQGHTEFLAEKFRTKNFGMMFVAGSMKTILATRHIPLNSVSRALTSQNVYKTITLSQNALRQHFNIKNPKIAVCGLNPHAGEGGQIGKEEITKIVPAIRRAQQNGINVDGPFSADTLFVPAAIKNYDIIVAMYHDQGLIAIKTLHFSTLVNLTVGLPFIRTSPAHGTAFAIAGKGKADPSSMEEAIRLAATLS